MNRSFLFITPLTPKKLLTPLRKMLFDEFLNSLKAQTYHNWQAILIGEDEIKDENITYLSCKAESKETKLIFAKEYLNNLKVKPDYIIRMDDDDVINPNILKSISNIDFDCYADQFHTFFDLVSGKISQQKRSWLANTVIHKYGHALAEVGPDKLPLMQADHSKDWVEYYSDKKIIYSSKKKPVYLRVLSPTTVTSGTSAIKTNSRNLSEIYGEFKSKASEIISVNDINFSEYQSYLETFGKWKHIELKDFSELQLKMESIWEKFSDRSYDKNLLIKLSKTWHSLVG